MKTYELPIRATQLENINISRLSFVVVYPEDLGRPGERSAIDRQARRARLDAGDLLRVRSEPPTRSKITIREPNGQTANYP